MRKLDLKLKLGAGQIIAFFVLAIVFASIAGVVFIAINQSPGKAPDASNAFAAGGLSVSTRSCDGNTASVSYNWNKAYYFTAGGADYQYLDVGTDSGFPAGTFYGQNVGTFTNRAGTVDKTQTLYWRINTHYSNGAWAASDSQRIIVTCPTQTETSYQVHAASYTVPYVNANNSKVQSFTVGVLSGVPGPIRLRIKRSGVVIKETDTMTPISSGLSWTWENTGLLKEGSYTVVVIDPNRTKELSNVDSFYALNRCDSNGSKSPDSGDYAAVQKGVGKSAGYVDSNGLSYRYLDLNVDGVINVGDLALSSAYIARNNTTAVQKACW